MSLSQYLALNKAKRHVTGAKLAGYAFYVEEQPWPFYLCWYFTEPTKRC